MRLCVLPVGGIIPVADRVRYRVIVSKNMKHVRLWPGIPPLPTSFLRPTVGTSFAGKKTRCLEMYVFNDENCSVCRFGSLTVRTSTSRSWPSYCTRCSPTSTSDCSTARHSSPSPWLTISSCSSRLIKSGFSMHPALR
jgi:hypothetical protein